MKFKYFLAATGICMVLLTGCSSSVNLSDNESDVIAEYIAGLVFKYDKDYDELLINPADLEKEQPAVTVTPIPTAKPISEDVSGATDKDSISKDSTTKNESTQVNAKFSEVIGLKNLKIEYSGYEVIDSYNDPYFTIESGKDKELLMVKFKVKNTSKKDVKINLSKKNIVFQLDINTGILQKPLLTFLDNDLRMIDTVVKAGSSIETVLVFHIVNDLKLEGVDVIITQAQKTATVSLK